jgi:uncharacterized protein YjbJ (UPF0337 family)
MPASRGDLCRMKHFTFDDHWDAIQGQLKQRYSQLTDDDLAFAEGKGEEMLAGLAQKLGIAANDLDALLAELHADACGNVDRVKARLSEMAGDARAAAGAAVDDLKGRAAAVGEEVKAQAGVAYDQARRHVRSWRDDGVEYVRNNPRESLVGALCAGFVAGLLIRR